jgi:hypothetical protein
MTQLDGKFKEGEERGEERGVALRRHGGARRFLEEERAGNAERNAELR